MARTFALIALVWRVLQQVSCSSKTVPNAPNGKKRTKRWVYGPMVWIVSISCNKLWHDFVARTFTLIAPVWRILHQVSSSSEMVTNALKGNETHQNMSLGSNGVDRERRCEKFWHDIMARTFALISPVWRILQQVSCSSERFQMHPNGKEGSKTWD